MEKLRAIVFGVYDRYVQKVKNRLQEFIKVVDVISPEKRRSFKKKPGVDVVIVLRKLASKSNFKDAEEASKFLPVVMADTENYVEQELRQKGLLKSETKKTESSTEPATTKPAEPSSETKLGLTAEELCEKYFTPAVRFVEGVINSGERIDEADLIDSMSSLIGLPEEDCKQLLPQLASKGLIVNTVGTTWKRVGGGGVEYELDENDKVEAPKKRKDNIRQLLVSKVRGLHPGPYASLYSIGTEMEKYKDFFRQDGKPATSSYHLIIAQDAFTAGLIEKKVEDGKDRFYVNNDPSVDLTLVELPKQEAPPEPPKTKQEKRLIEAIQSKKEVHFPELEKLAGKAAHLWELRKTASKEEEPKKVDLKNPEAVRALFKIEMPALLPGQVKLIRSLLPNRHWEEAAVKALQKRLVRVKSPLKNLPRELFSNDEWDSLAWETLSGLPMGVVAATFRELYEDRECLCSECNLTFVFTRGEQEHFFRTFEGEVTAPRRCPSCRKARRESGSNYEDRILRRHGG